METLAIVEGRPRLRLPLSGRYVAGRLAAAALAVWATVTLVFFCLHASGSPATLLVGADAPPGELARVTRLMGYDRPLAEQYATFLWNAVQGDFPDSIRYGVSPLSLVADRIGASLLLGGAGLALGTLAGLAAGYLGVYGRHAVARRLPLSLATLLQSMPSFVLGLLLILVFSVGLRWLPSSGSGELRHLVLPALTLAAFAAATVGRVFRAELLDARDRDHVRTALAKGVSPRVVRLRHVAANALVPTLNVVGVSAGMMLGGAVVVESLFGWPGLGQLAVAALANRDYPVILADVCVLAVGFVTINLVVDLATAALDPRTRR